MNAKQIWQSVLERIQPKVSQATFNAWFGGTNAVSLKGHRLTVYVGTTFGRAHLENRFHDLICSALSDLLGAEAEVTFEVGQPEERARVVVSAEPIFSTAPNGSQEPSQPALEDDGPQELPHPLRQSALMSVAAARRDRLEAAQEGRRLSRRALPYAGPELLPIAGPVVVAPLLTQLHSSLNGHDTDSPPPTRQEEQRNGNQHAATLALEPARPLLLASGGEIPGEDRLNGASTTGAGASWDLPSPAHDSSLGSNGSNGPPAGEGVFNAGYTFSTFIVGESNKMAHNAASAVAAAPGRQYNPLVFQSGVGLGKTHLLHAIAQHAMADGLNVLYTTSDRFTNEIINAIRFHTTEEFRAKYRQIDVLLVDDIQFIAGKESTEEEFFHTFNALHNANKQIVLTTDRPPKAMLTLQDRLRSRFEWGLIADIRSPDEPLRVAILHAKSQGLYLPTGEPLEFPDEVIEFLAHPRCESVRELEGILNSVVAFARMTLEPVTITLAKRALGQIQTDSRKRLLEPTRVLEVVTRHFNVSLELLLSKQRDRDIVWPRQVAMFLMREEASAKLEQIGDELHRDHSTVIHSLTRVEHKIAQSDRVRKEIAGLREELRTLAPPEGTAGD